MKTILETKSRIENLLSYASDLAKRAKNLQSLLYKQKDEVEELDNLEKVSPEFLEAYLLWKSIKRANYQPRHLDITSFDVVKLLEFINKEVDLIENRNFIQVANELTDEEVLGQLVSRMKDGKINKYYDKGFMKLGIWNKEGNWIVRTGLDGSSIELEKNEEIKNIEPNTEENNNHDRKETK